MKKVQKYAIILSVESYLTLNSFTKKINIKSSKIIWVKNYLNKIENLGVEK